LISRLGSRISNKKIFRYGRFFYPQTILTRERENDRMAGSWAKEILMIDSIKIQVMPSPTRCKCGTNTRYKLEINGVEYCPLCSSWTTSCVDVLRATADAIDVGQAYMDTVYPENAKFTRKLADKKPTD